MDDAYAQAVEYLTANPEQIRDAWRTCGSHPAGCLFLFVTKDGRCNSNPHGESCGCLTIIRLMDHRYAWTRELTRAIRADTRLPDGDLDITVDHLPVFAGWQRRIDKLLNRTPPALDSRLPMPTGDIEIPEPADVLV